MSKNQTIDNNSSNDTEISTENLDSNFGPTCGTKDIVKKAIHVTGRSTWKGAPTEMTPRDQIGEDGKIDRFSVQFVEKFDVMIKGEKVKVSSVYITSLMYKQLDRLIPGEMSIDMMFKEGKQTGVLYIVKRKNLKPQGMNYWSFINEKQLKEIEIVN